MRDAETERRQRKIQADRLVLRRADGMVGRDLEIVQGMAVTGLTWQEAAKLHKLLGVALELAEIEQTLADAIDAQASEGE